MMAKFLTTADRVYHDVRGKIVSGELAPGERLVHRKLAAELGTSNIPVVEAIRRLERDGLVVNHPGCGAEVTTWTPDDLLGVCVFREVLEGAACRLFVHRATSLDKLVLKDYGSQFDAYVTANDVSGAVETDKKLHMHIIKCGNSPALYRLAESFSVVAATLQSYGKEDFVIGPAGVHDELIEVLTRDDADPELAERVGRNHVHNGPLKE